MMIGIISASSLLILISYGLINSMSYFHERRIRRHVKSLMNDIKEAAADMKKAIGNG